MLKKPILMVLQAIAALAVAGCPAYPCEGPVDPVATPIVAGTISSTVAGLVLLAVLFMTLNEYRLWCGTLRYPRATAMSNRINMYYYQQDTDLILADAAG